MMYIFSVSPRYSLSCLVVRIRYIFSAPPRYLLSCRGESQDYKDDLLADSPP